MKLYKKQYNTSLSFADLLNFGVMITPNLMLGKDGSLTAGLVYTCWDYENSDNSELNDLVNALNAAYLRLGTGITLHFTVIRSETSEYPQPEKSHFTSLLNKLIDEERRIKWESAGAHFSSVLSFSITYLPESMSKSRLSDFFVTDESGTKKSKSLTDKHIEYFESVISELSGQLSGTFTLHRLGMRRDSATGVIYNDLVQYFNHCISGDNYPVIHPDNQFLDAVLSTDDFYTEPRLKIGNKYISVLCIDAYPSESVMGMLQSLSNLPCEYRWTTRAIFLDPIDADKQIEKYRKGWGQKVRGFVDQLMGKHSDNINYDAATMKEDAQIAKGENNSNTVRYLYLTPTIVIMDEDIDRLDETTNLIRTTIKNVVNFNARIETVNAMDAYLGSLPSHTYENVRRPLLHTGNMTHIVPCSTLWTGEETSPCPFFPPDSPPLMKVSTTGNSEFNLNLHEDDVGHGIIGGKTGAGKSSLVTLISSQYDRYPDSQVFTFDKGRSAKVFCKLSGGKYYDIMTGEHSLNFAPLARIDEPSEFIWAFEWLQDIAEINGVKLDSEKVKKLNEALKIVSRMDNKDGQYRNIDSLITKLQDRELKDLFSQYGSGGAYGEVLNQPQEQITLSNFTVFEYGELLDRGNKIKLPVLFYLCHLIERQLDGRPTLVNIDEAWKFLDEPVAGKRLLQWLREWRKSNAAVVISTQNLHIIEKAFPLVFSEIAMACPTKLFLSNPAAEEEVSINAYKILGCKAAEIRRIRHLTPKREYFVKKGDFRRTFSLDMVEGDIGLATVAASSKKDLKEIDKLDFEHSSEEELLHQWLDFKGVDSGYVQYLTDRLKSRGEI
ncbi:hypothetical protein GQB61_004292 [Salmonella enterica]|nr:hypothetical protein [Salmonella enterica]